MISPSYYRDLVSGRQGGLTGHLLRGLFRAVEAPYAWAMTIRNRRYDRGRAEIHRVDAPVVSVGNLTLGGTGKTPLVEWIARRLRQQGVRVAIVSRGYGAPRDGLNDEALELELALPDVPHLQSPDRVASARTAIAEYASQALLLDDGFQHRRLARDLDIVLLDATEPFGFAHVFPRGTLREPLAGVARADVVVLSRADMIDQAARGQIRRRVARLAPRAIWCEVEHHPQALTGVHGEELPLAAIEGKRIAAFCGIGNPPGFRHTLETLGCELTAWREFADHHRYTRDDIESLAQWSAEADWVLCTRKDLVKLRSAAWKNTPLWALNIELQFLEGQQPLEKALDEIVVK